MARDFDLPNHAHAASPCLRSRLALGVQATSRRLQNIEAAENIARAHLKTQVHHNLRVRHLAQNTARIEADPEILAALGEDVLGSVAMEIAELGFARVTFKEFKSGSVSMASSPWSL